MIWFFNWSYFILFHLYHPLPSGKKRYHLGQVDAPFLRFLHFHGSGHVLQQKRENHTTCPGAVGTGWEMERWIWWNKCWKRVPQFGGMFGTKYVWQKACSYSVLLMSNSKSQPLFEFVLLLAALQPATRLQVPLSLAVCSPKSRRSGHDLHRWSAVNDLHPFHAVHAFGNLGCCWFLVRVSR